MKQILICILILSALCACEYHSSPPDLDIDSGILSIHMDRQHIPSEVVRLHGLLSREDFDTIRFEFEDLGNSPSVLIENIPVGVWKVEIYALNSEGLTIFYGFATVSVVSHQVTPVSIQLSRTGSVQIVVIWPDAAYEVFRNCLVVLTRDGTLFMDFDGNILGTLDIGGSSSYQGVQVYNEHLYILDNAEITEIDENGYVVARTPAPGSMWFAVLPDSRFAMLDNRNDSIHIIDTEGNIIISLGMLHSPDKHLQNVNGWVVGNSLIISEDGNDHLLEVDLQTYEVSIFKDCNSFVNYPEIWLNDITYRDGTYYLCQAKTIWTFSDPNGDVTKLTTLPEGNITSIVISDNYAYCPINFSGNVYKINLLTGQYELLASGLDYPDDMCAW